MEDSRADMLEELRRTGDRFRREVGAVPDEVWRLVPDPGTWSPELIAEHLALVEVSTARLVAGKLFAERAAAEMLAETVGKVALLRRSLPDRGRLANTPEFVAPHGRWVRRDEIMGAFQEARAQTIEILSDPARDLAAHAWQHALFGPLTAHQWGVFLSLHLERHLAQLADVLGRVSPNAAGSPSQ